MFGHILVPLDGSSFGEASLRPALAIARRTGARLTLLNVQDLWSAAPLPHTYEAREEYLARLRRDPRWGDVPVKIVVRTGHPMDQILQEVEAGGADLIVMSTHGRGGFSRFWLGSVADQCVRHAGVPVLLTRPRPSGEGNGDAPFLPHRLIIPLDGMAAAERALPEAAELGRALGIPVLLLRVVEPGGDGARSRNDEGQAIAYLTEVAQRLWALGVQTTTKVVRDRGAADAIVAEAAGDPVVMSTHARAPVARALLGSVADKVVRGTRGAVLVVPPSAAGKPEAAGTPGDGPDLRRSPPSGVPPSVAR
jgi:nucleotide-binding universal stress UspA family protein